MTFTLGAILAYLVLQFGIGVWASRRVKSESDYLLAGRSLGYTLATFSIFATWFGAETVVGSAGNAYRDGVSLASAEPFGYGICLLLMGLIFAVPLRRRRLTTLADLFRQRYSVRVERLAAVVLIPSSILWAAAQIRAFGGVIATAADGIDINVAIAVATAFTLAYTVFGGLLADALTDLVQGIMLAVGLVVVLVAVLLQLPEGVTLASALSAPGAVAALPAAGGVSFLDLAEEWAIPICGSVVATELVGRIIATRTEGIARRSSLTAGALYVSIGVIPLMLGLLGRSVVPGITDAEHVIPEMATKLLPVALYAVFAGGLISAILSTVDSTLLISSGLLSHNLLVPMLRVTDERTKVRLARGGVMAFGVLAYVLAVRAEGVFALVEQASAFGSAGTLVVVCFALFTRIGGPRAAAATIVAGVVVYLTASLTGSAYPFLLSLGASLATYAAGAGLEHGARRLA